VLKHAGGDDDYIAARFFLQTIYAAGELTVQVAHSEESAQAIFNIVHRFWENLPNKRVRRDALVKSRSKRRQIVFPGSIAVPVETADDNAGGDDHHNLHCSEVSRWPRDGGEILASCGRRWCPERRRLLLGVDSKTAAAGIFYEEWAEGGRRRIRAALFSVVV